MNLLRTAPPALTLPLRQPRPFDRGEAPAIVRPAAGIRFTRDGSAELEQHLARMCGRITAGVRGVVGARRLETILLGGGYGRGEGGVLRTSSGDEPYNDLEFYVCIRGNRHLNERRFGHALHVLGEILTPQAGIEVEFKITSLRELSRAPVSMFSYDLLTGHVQLAGDPAQLARCAHHHEARQIPLSEATRLLMNRCSGLLFARERLQRDVFTAADADFVRRNIAKAQLALGDALLVLDGQYHTSVRERHRHIDRLARIDSIPWLREVATHHASGVEFKLHPERSTASPEELARLHEEVTRLALVVFLEVEAKRLHHSYAGAADYAMSHCPKWPEAHGPRNVLVHLKTLGTRSLLSRRVLRHPRERILHALALLLWEPATLLTPALLHHVQQELRTNETSYAGLVQRYQALWSRVN